jgi:hypothetical protein
MKLVPAGMTLILLYRYNNMIINGNNKISVMYGHIDRFGGIISHITNAVGVIMCSHKQKNEAH